MHQKTLEYLEKGVAQLDRIVKLIREETDQVVASGDHIEIIKHFNHVRQANELVKEGRKSLDNMSDHLSRVVVPDTVKDLKERTGEKPPFNIDGVGRVSVSYRFSCSMIDKDKGIEWLRSEGHGGIVQETVNSSTLASFAKNLLEVDGIELPDDKFKISTSPYTSITKA